MRPEDEEAYSHRAVGLLERGVASGEELLQCDEVAERLAHLLPVDGYHVVVHPVLHHLVALRRRGLRYLALVVREHQVHASAVYVEVVAEVLPAHRCALAVPPGEAHAPRRAPPHDVLRLRLLPQREVRLVALLAHAIQRPRVVYHVVEVPPAQFPIVEFLVILLYVEVHRAVALVGEAVVHYLPHQFLLLDDVPRGVRLYRGRQHVERVHRLVVAVRVVLRDLHRLELLEPCLLLYLVVALVGVVLEVSHVGDVPDVAHLVAQVPQVPEEHVERYRRARVSQVRVAIHRRAAHIHAHVWRVQRHETLLLPVKGVVDQKILFHHYCRLYACKGNKIL